MAAKKKLTPEELEARLKDIIWLRRHGSTYTWIGKKFGVSRGRIRQIYLKWLDEQAAEKKGEDE